MISLGVTFGALTLAFLALTTEVIDAPEAKPCTQAWFLYLDDHYIQAIGEGDDVDGGPDLGDNAWFRWFEGKAKITTPPQLSQQQRCRVIQEKLQERLYIVNKAFGSMLIFKVRKG